MNVTRVDDETITAILPDGSNYVSIADLAIFKTQKIVVVRDNRGTFYRESPYSSLYLMLCRLYGSARERLYD